MKKLIAGCIAALCACSLVADEATAWEYDADAGTITDGNWTLVVTNTADRSLTLGVPTTYTNAEGTVKWPWDESVFVKDLRPDGRLLPPFAFPASIEGQGLSSSKLDLSLPVYTKDKVGDEDELWQITKVSDLAFNNKNAYMDGITITSFTAPTNLTSWGYQVFCDYTKLTEVIFNCPNLTGVFGNGGYTFKGSPITHLVLNIPKVTEITANSFLTATMSETDLSEWDLSSVFYIWGAGLAAEANTSGEGGPKGDLVLPSLQTAEKAAFDCWTRVSSISFGSKGNLKSLGETLMWNQDAKNGGFAAGPKKIYFGKNANFTLHEFSFLSEKAGKVADYPNGVPLPVEEIYFMGAAPSVETLDRILVAQEAAEDGSKPVKIYAPLGLTSWQEVCKAVADDELESAAAVETATGGRVVGVYETEDGRRPAWLMASPWEYDAEAQTISDGTWTLAVTNTVDRELALGPAAEYREDGRTAAPFAFPADLGSQKGDLDLAGTVYTKGKVGDTSEVWAITELLDSAFRSAGGITSFSAPMTLKKMGSSVFSNLASLTNVVFICPEMEGPFASADGVNAEFNTCNIQRLVLKLPKVTQIGASTGANDNKWYNFAKSTFSDTDVSDWDLSSVKEVRRGSFEAGGAVKGVLGGPTGDLDLPNVETVARSVWDNWTQLSSIAFGTNGTLKSIGQGVIWNGTGVAMVGPKKLDFGLSYDFTVDANAFTANSVANADGSTAFPFEEIWFASRAPSQTALDNILVKQKTIADKGVNAIKIFAPTGKPSWLALRSDFTDDEKTLAAALVAEGYDVTGVYETAAGDRVAWLVRNPNIKDPAFIIRIR